MDKIQEQPTEAWGYIAVKVNELITIAEDLERKASQLNQRMINLEEIVPRKKSPEEIKEIKRANMAKARAARASRKLKTVSK